MIPRYGGFQRRSVHEFPLERIEGDFPEEEAMLEGSPSSDTMSEKAYHYSGGARPRQGRAPPPTP